MDFFIEVLVDSVVDTLELLPFLFVTYLVMEGLEHKTGGRMQRLVTRAGRGGPIVGSLLGAVPQCGFSAMAATLYSGGIITAGTLVAVLLSTSDELIPVFIAHQGPLPRLLAILLVKVVVGIVVGLLLDFALKALHKANGLHPRIHELCERANCHCDDASDAEGAGDAHHESCCSHDHGHDHGSGKLAIVRAAAIHTGQVLIFIFLITFLFGLLIEGVGSEAISDLLSAHPVRATLLAALVGLIPNCGASVTISELYLDGVLASGPMIAGLLSAGGVGLLVLYRTNAHPRENILITLFVYVVSVIAGLIVGALGIVF